MAQGARSEWMPETSQRRLRDEDPEKYFTWCLSYPYFLYGDGVEVEIVLFAPGMSQWIKVENAVWTTIQETKEKHNLNRNPYMLSESSSGPERDVFEEACKVVQDHPDFPRPRPQARENEKHFYHSKLPKILISHVNHKVMSMYADLQFGKKRKRTGEDPEHDKKDTMSAHKVKKPKDDQQLTPDNHHCPQPSVDQKHQQDPSLAIELKPAPVPELRLLVASSLSCVLRVKFSLVFGQPPDDIPLSEMTMDKIIMMLKSTGDDESPQLVFVYRDGDNTKVANDMMLQSAFCAWRSEQNSLIFSLYIDNRLGESLTRPALPHPDKRI
ncbi:hypothetical protein PV08_10161 [Exophiala spinifera]|uniref:Uncharacterized protein n=1 Tax=Exophiala spinifera TaxID=91928 RepID=A0A0D1ZCW3_9EURO|nr:uncharacterized protein PV08_10161 [Exophiala spinifera]KIW10862.1 hypothetical protein PV08_10161 [Exophiala spinifera]